MPALSTVIMFSPLSVDTHRTCGARMHWLPPDTSGEAWRLPLLRRLGEAAAQVLLHPAQADDHRFQDRRIDPLGHECTHLGAVAFEVAQDRRSCWRQSQTPDAPIGGIGAALDCLAPPGGQSGERP